MAPSTRSPFLSVIVTTCDRAALLSGALESLSRQTLERDAFEIVLVDDGSRDATPEVATAASARLPLRYSYQRNAGIASARNHGIFMARAQEAPGPSGARQQASPGPRLPPASLPWRRQRARSPRR